MGEVVGKLVVGYTMELFGREYWVFEPPKDHKETIGGPYVNKVAGPFLTRAEATTAMKEMK